MSDTAIVASTDTHYNQRWVADNRRYMLRPEAREGPVFTESDVSDEEGYVPGGQVKQSALPPETTRG